MGLNAISRFLIRRRVARFVPPRFDVRRLPLPGDLVLVPLPMPARRCVHCVTMSFIALDPLSHASWHKLGSTFIPRRWVVTGDTNGEILPLGTSLALVEAKHQQFWEWEGWEAVNYLLEALDPPLAGSIYYVSTNAWYDGDRRFIQPYDAPGHPLAPPGLTAARDQAGAPLHA